MHTSVIEKPGIPLTADSSTTKPQAGKPTCNKLRRFLQAYWLRPENAYWMTLRSDALDRCQLASPSVDVSCGDGLFTFLHLEGTLDPCFDVFSTVASLDRVLPDHLDMFDHVDEDYEPTILAEPVQTIDVGTDLKPAMLTKAQRLALYKQLIQHDNNNKLPFDTGYFQTIYCNSAYWVTNIDGFLSELGRITTRGGRIILQVKLDAMQRYTLEPHRAQLGDEVLRIMGRGRLECWNSLADRQTWEKRFHRAGLSIVDEYPFITATHAHVWDVGLRPIAPLLVKMANSLAPEKREAIKAEWVDLFETLLTPFCRSDMNLTPQKGEPGEIQYILQQR